MYGLVVWYGHITRKHTEKLPPSGQLLAWPSMGRIVRFGCCFIHAYIQDDENVMK